MTTKVKIYQALAAEIGRMDNLYRMQMGETAHTVRVDVEDFVRDRFPRGSGFDIGTTLDFDQSTPDKLVFNTAFHHMDEHGDYDGWTEHKVFVTASLQYGYSIRVTGREHKRGGDIKDYIAEQFGHIVSGEVEPYTISPVRNPAVSVTEVLGAYKDAQGS